MGAKNALHVFKSVALNTEVVITQLEVCQAINVLLQKTSGATVALEIAVLQTISLANNAVGYKQSPTSYPIICFDFSSRVGFGVRSMGFHPVDAVKILSRLFVCSWGYSFRICTGSSTFIYCLV